MSEGRRIARRSISPHVLLSNHLGIRTSIYDSSHDRILQNALQRYARSFRWTCARCAIFQIFAIGYDNPRTSLIRFFFSRPSSLSPSLPNIDYLIEYFFRFHFNTSIVHHTRNLFLTRHPRTIVVLDRVGNGFSCDISL